MSLTNFPNGISSFGVPVLGGGSIPATTGNTYFVSSGAGSSGAVGTSPSNPLATIDQAINKCTADKGDQIIVMPGHAETIASATSLVVDVAGISIIGLGNGRNRPVLSFSATASRIPVSANDVLIEGLVFLGAVADIVSGVTVTGDDVTIRDCEWASGSAILEFLQCLDIDASERTRIENCRFYLSATAGSAAAIRVDATELCTIIGCEIRGDFTTTAAIDGNVGSGAASTNIRISHNVIENLDTTAGLLVDMHDNTTGIIELNRGYTAYTTNITAPFDTGATRAAENYVSNLVDETAGISPATPSA
jgi:hypothetical protein